MYDDDLEDFEAHGVAPPFTADEQGHVAHDGARIWYATYGTGAPVVLLHGGLGHSGNWGHQVAPLVAAGHRAVLVDSRGHGRSTRDDRPYTYELMATDVLAVLDHLRLAKAVISDGACVAMILGDRHPERVSGVFYFGCNMDPSGTKEIEFTPILERCISHHMKDYA